MFLKWLKWRLYIRTKNKWGNLNFLNFNMKGFQILKVLLLYRFLYSIFFYVVSYFVISKLSYFLITPQKKLGNISLLNNISFNYFIWSIYFLMVLIYAIVIGKKISDYFMNTQDHIWLSSILGIPKKNQYIWVFGENLIWKSIPILFWFLPISLSINNFLELGVYVYLKVLVLSIISYLLISLFSFYIYNNISFKRQKNMNWLSIFIVPVFLRTLIFYFMFQLGLKFSPWFIKFPLTRNGVNPEEFYKWIENGKTLSLTVFSNWINSLFHFIYLPNNIFASFIIDSIEYKKLFFSIFIYLIIGYSVILLIKINIPSNRISNRIKLYFFNGLNRVALLGLNPKNYAIFKTVLTSKYVKRKLPNLYGNLFFWAMLGFFSSILSLTTNNMKIHYLALVFLMFFPIYFYVHNIIKGFVGKISFESDKNLLLLFLISGKNIWLVFRIKLLITNLIIFPFIFIGDLMIFCIGNISIKLLFLLIGVHASSMVLFVLICTIPNILSPHFNYLNVEEINEYPDKQFIEQGLYYFMTGFFIPFLMLPTALYLTDNISDSLYITVQFTLCIIVNSMFSFILTLCIRYKVSKQQILEDILN